MPPELKYGNEVQAQYIYLLDGDRCTAASSKERAHNNHRVGYKASYNMVLTDWKSLPSSNQTHI